MTTLNSLLNKLVERKANEITNNLLNSVTSSYMQNLVKEIIEHGEQSLEHQELRSQSEYGSIYLYPFNSTHGIYAYQRVRVTEASAYLESGVINTYGKPINEVLEIDKVKIIRNPALKILKDNPITLGAINLNQNGGVSIFLNDETNPFMEIEVHPDIINANSSDWSIPEFVIVNARIFLVLAMIHWNEHFIEMAKKRDVSEIIHGTAFNIHWLEVMKSIDQPFMDDLCKLITDKSNLFSFNV